MEENKYTLEEFIDILKTIELINPYHINLKKSGCGEFPDSYQFTEVGAERLKKQIKLELK